MIKKCALLIASAIVLNGCADRSQETQNRWQSLFDGETLNGWQIINGDEPFVVANGEIIGKTATGIPTRYFATQKQYRDFILELDMNNAEGENSGVQFRSVQAPQFRAGLTGYQMEVDPSARAWTGGIFFEGMGQWRYPIIDNPRCTAAWNSQDWNTLRIEAKGTLIRSFVNGQPCAYLYDDTVDSGYIALQIHSIGTMPGRANAPTRWRNIKIIENPLETDYSKTDNTLNSISYLIDQLSPHETAHNWRLLTPDTIGQEGWVSLNITNPVTHAPSTIRGLTVDALKGDRSFSLQDIKTGYALVADVQMSPGTKGIINYPVMKSTAGRGELNCVSSFAIFDDISIDYRKSKADYLMGSVPGMVTAKNLSETNRRKRVLAPEKWQRIKIVVKGQHVEHWLNAVKVADFAACDGQENKTAENGNIQIKLENGTLNLSTLKYRPD